MRWSAVNSFSPGTTLSRLIRNAFILKSSKKALIFRYIVVPGVKMDEAWTILAFDIRSGGIVSYFEVSQHTVSHPLVLGANTPTRPNGRTAGRVNAGSAATRKRTNKQSCSSYLAPLIFLCEARRILHQFQHEKNVFLQMFIVKSRAKKTKHTHTFIVQNCQKLSQTILRTRYLLLYVRNSAYCSLHPKKVGCF